jgi:site-specific recombinase XerD
MPAKAKHLRIVESSEKRPVAAGRQPNSVYRTREHLTEKEMAVLLDTLKTNRHGLRDWLIYRHGLRVSEACDLSASGVSQIKEFASKFSHTMLS